MSHLIVDDPGPLSLLQDLGRPGFAAIGVSTSGAFDRGAHRLANRLVGNDETAITIETILGGLRIRVDSATTIAVTGACGPLLRIDASAAVDGQHAIAVDRNAPLTLGAGQALHVGMPIRGLRAYLAVRGGIQAPLTLGSAAHDMLSGLGTPPLRAHDVLGIGDPPARGINVDFAPLADPSARLEVIPGPHDQPGAGSPRLLGAEALAVLDSGTYVVQASSDRIGVRLAGPALPRIAGELPSAPMRPGAIQVPGDGQPIVLGPDAPTTGGFPVIGTLTPVAHDALGQARPGDALRFAVLRPNLRHPGNSLPARPAIVSLRPS